MARTHKQDMQGTRPSIPVATDGPSTNQDNSSTYPVPGSTTVEHTIKRDQSRKRSARGSRPTSVRDAPKVSKPCIPHDSLPSNTVVSGSSSALLDDPLYKTPDKAQKKETSSPPTSFFTPATGVQPDPHYTLAEDKEWTREDAFEANRQRAEGHIIMGISVEDFMDKCMGGYSKDDHSPEALEELSKDLFTKEKVPAAHGESQFYEAIVKSGILKALVGQGLIPKDTHVIRGADVNNLKKKYSPDFTALRKDVPLEKACLERARSILKGAEGYGDQKSEEEDPIKDTDKGRWSFGQLITYAEVMTSNAHRTHIFSFVLLPEDARLIRFDRSGIIISERFPWRISGHLLAFLSRLAQMTPAERGWDTSVSLISPTDPRVERAREWLRRPETILGGALPSDMSVEDIFPDHVEGFGDLSMFHVYDEASHTMHRVLAQRPFEYDSLGYIGQGSRLWVGVDLQEKRAVLLKDYWRDSRPGIPSESDIHRRFRTVDPPVQHTLEFAYGGDAVVDGEALWEKFPAGSKVKIDAEDLEFQTTWSHEFCERHQYPRLQSVRCSKPEASIEIVPRTHHFAVFNTLVRRLCTFKSTKELVGVLHDVTEALQQAHNVNILHRNITTSSVGIDSEGHGRLMNWDSTGEVTRSVQLARRKSRMVSLHTVSVDHLRDPHKRDHLLRDDLESIVYLMFLLVLRFRPPAPGSPANSRGDILSGLRTVFENCFTTENGEIRGGLDKKAFLTGGSSLNDTQLMDVVQPVALWTLMRGCRRLFQHVYTDEPRLFAGADEEEEAGFASAVEQWKALRDAAQKNLSSARPFLNYFRKALDTPGWPSSDGAIDQYPPSSRPALNNRAFTGNRASSRQSSLRSGMKRSLASYGTGTGNLPPLPSAKRLKSSVTHKASRSYVSDEGEPWDDDLMEDVFTVQGHRGGDKSRPQAPAGVTEETIFLGFAH
ncbi:unnamed protein product [Peniophora sp. CBMAI 1063]|nr:unnamed protein product [Peniophora sp. CBMAI 1063]